MNYKQIFDERGHAYNQAHLLCPNARQEERQILIDLVEPVASDIIIDAPAGGGYVAAALYNQVEKIICIEPSSEFATGMPSFYETINCPVYRVPLETNIATKFTSLAGLHHLNERELNQTFSEAHRLLKRDGRCVVADVKKGSLQDAFLNGPVDKYSNTGHVGRFFAEGELSHFLKKTGFKEITEKYHLFRWSFQNEAEMYGFVKNLFGLTKAASEDVRNSVNECLNVEITNYKATLQWGLIYAAGTR